MTNSGLPPQVDERIEELYQRHLPLEAGSVASYYDSARGYYGPEEAGHERDTFGICIVTIDGRVHQAGDWDVPFALQSISKVFAYALALADRGRARVLEHVGVEPSGDSFNSIVFDERNHRPYNPMVNAGALVTSDLVRGSHAEEKIERILTMLRLCAANDELAVHEQTFRSELRGADRNRATAYLMRSEGMLDGDVEELLALYLQQCSVHVTCRDLAVMGATLANGCTNPSSGDRVFPRERVRDVLSVMHTCGMYDAAGAVDLRRRRAREERGERRPAGGGAGQGWHRRLLTGARRLRQQRARGARLRRRVRAPRPARVRHRGRGRAARGARGLGSHARDISAVSDGAGSGRRIMRNPFRSPSRPARIGTISAIWRASGRASVLMSMISS